MPSDSRFLPTLACQLTHDPKYFMGFANSNEEIIIPFHNGTNVSSQKSLLSMAPSALRPYLELIRLEKPTGTILMFWPCAWGLTMAAYTIGLPIQRYLMELLKCSMGAFLLRSSACTVNDICDRHVDAGVERTRNRPLPSGRVSVFAATLFLIAQYVIGVAFFYFSVQGIAFYVALCQLLPLFAIYPILKQYTYWPQAWLGFAMNFGLITAWIATTSNINLPLLSTSIMACWCWTMLYDTVYACQDIRDDLKMGVRSTAILFGDSVRPLLVCCGLGFLSLLAITGWLNSQGYAYFGVSIGGTGVHLAWQYMSVDLDMPQSCWEIFNRNGQLGWIIWLGLMVDYGVSMNLISFR